MQMRTNGVTLRGRPRGRFFLFSLCLVGLLSGSALAQDNPFGESESKGETKLDDFERKTFERKGVDEEEKGPGFKRGDASIATWQSEAAEYQEKAIKLLKRRIEGADIDDPDLPVLYERLAEMLWQKAKKHELMAFDYLEQSRDYADQGQDSKAQESLRLQEEALKVVEEARAETIEVYSKIQDEFPLYENMDKVLFFLAFNLQEIGYAAQAHEKYQQLVRDYPETEYLGDAYLGMAEYTYNIEEDMDAALDQYSLAIAAAPGTATAGYAMYKTGWCYFNLGEPETALQQFVDVIELAEKDPSRNGLKKEATKDLVRAYSMWTEASAKKAKRFFKKHASDDEHLNSMLERLALLYAEDGQVDKAIIIYNQLISDNVNHFRHVGYQIEIMLNIETKNDPDLTAEAIILTVKLFRKALDNDKLEGKTPELEKEYYALLEEYTRETAKWYHLTAQTTKNATYYALAYEIYKVYIENFPEAEDNYEMMYYYAELLYWKKNWAEAARRYDQTLDIDEKGKYSNDAAYGAVLAYNKLAETPSDECPPIPVPPETAEGEEPVFPRFEIAQCRQRLIAACERYSRIVEDAEHLVDIRYTSARIYYDHNHMEEAIDGFKEVAVNHPDHRLGMISANLMLDSLYIGKRFEEMWEWVIKFKEMPALYKPPFDVKLDELEVGLAFKFCVDKEEAKEWEEAATCFEDYATKYEYSAYAPKALWNASVDWENASEIGKAIETRIRLLREHGGDEELAPKALFAIGQNYHGIAVYSEAARFYELFVDKYPSNDTACVESGLVSDVPCSQIALQNAAAFRGGLGQYEQAVKDYDRYIEMFPKDKQQISDLKFNTGRIYFDQGLYDSAIERYNEYLKKYAKLGPQSKTIAAHTAIGRSYWKKEQQRSALKSFERAEEIYESKKTQKWMADETTEEKYRKEAYEAAAEARFMRGEYIFGQALAVQLSDESVAERKMEAHLQRQLKKKAELMQEAEPIYVEVITRFPTPKWGLASMCRLGMMYHDVASQIQNAPVPKRLNEEQSLIYEDLLLEFADKFEQKAIGYYVTAVEKAAELGWFSDYTTLAQRRLFDLRPEEYRSASEIKAQPDRASVTWHRAGHYDDIEMIMGRKTKKARGPIDLEEGEMDAVDETTPEASPEAAANSEAGGEQ